MFLQENCLQLTQERNQGRAADLAKHRMSEHKLNIKVGGTKTKPREKMRVRKRCIMISVLKQ